MSNPTLPPEVKQFADGSVEQSRPPKSIEQYEQLHETELVDVKQQVKMRPLVAIFFGALLLLQNWSVFELVGWSLEHGKLQELQLIFSVLIAGSLTQTYKISQLIVNKLLEAINYADKHNRFTK